MDRNKMPVPAWIYSNVALRKESVDRNNVIRPAIDVFLAVALRKESVDRNIPKPGKVSSVLRRSPQGERG